MLLSKNISHFVGFEAETVLCFFDCFPDVDFQINKKHFFVSNASQSFFYLKST